MQAVAVAEVIVTLEPLRPLAQGPTLHICFIVLHQSILKQSDGTLIVAFVIQPNCCCEQLLHVDTGETEDDDEKNGISIYDLCSLWTFIHHRLLFSNTVKTL